MNEQQRKRAQEVLRNSTEIEANGKALALLQELVDAPTPEPFGYFKAEPFGWTDCAETDDGAIALFAAPPHQSEHHLEMVNTPAPSVPDMPLSMEQFGGLVGLARDDAREKAIVYKATNIYGETCYFGVKSTAVAWAKGGKVDEVRLKELRVVAAPTPAEPSADLVQDSVASEPVGYLYTNLQSGEYHVSDADDDYRGPERVLWCIEPVYRRAKGQP